MTRQNDRDGDCSRDHDSNDYSDDNDLLFARSRFGKSARMNVEIGIGVVDIDLRVIPILG